MKKIKDDFLLRIFVQISVIIAVMYAVMNIIIYAVDKKSGAIVTVSLAVYLIVVIFVLYKKSPKFSNTLVKYAANYDKIQNRLLKDLLIPYAIVDLEGNTLWANEAYLDIVGDDKCVNKPIYKYFEDLDKDKLPVQKMSAEEHIEFNGINYRVHMNQLNMDNLFGIVDKQEYAEEITDNRVIAVYLYDETEIIKCMKENNEQKLVVGLIYIDNYEEVFEDVDEVKRALLAALVERKLTKYMHSVDAIIKKLEKDKYFVIFKKKYLEVLHENKYSILSEVKNINVGNEIEITVSMGLGLDADTLENGYEYARAAIDLALGRGGDQVVEKDKDQIVYYGGKRVQVEKSTRVKARVKAQALREIIMANDDVFVMGHAIEDIDSFGSAVGIYRIARALGKKAHVVINEVTSTVKPFMHRFIVGNEYEKDMFLTGDKALEKVTENSILVVVDVNKPTYTECPELLNKIKTKIVFDHHRQTDETIEGAVLSYVEPYASSTCEMIAEILQYINDKVKLRTPEADAMFAGIMIDTNNFQTKTGVRTFEAAAFLRRNGADILRIRKALRTDMEEYRVRAAAISNVSLYRECFAITICHAEGFESPTIIGAQVANELLDMAGVKASFVMTPCNDKIYISARSIDEVNVQIIMEKLGGGGHMTVAGAQLEDMDVTKAREKIIEVLTEMADNGEI
ncbi:MAG: DHH family phosphoesterase [Lachnospiraceae bacterium]|nr:DHH family phosphoesterase [Lachnospiraceae bacterium]